MAAEAVVASSIVVGVRVAATAEVAVVTAVAGAAGRAVVVTAVVAAVAAAVAAAVGAVVSSGRGSSSGSSSAAVIIVTAAVSAVPLAILPSLPLIVTVEFFSLRTSSSRREMSQLVRSVKYAGCVCKSKQDAFTE